MVNWHPLGTIWHPLKSPGIYLKTNLQCFCIHHVFFFQNKFPEVARLGVLLEWSDLQIKKRGMVGCKSKHGGIGWWWRKGCHPEVGGPFSKKMLLEINTRQNQNDRHILRHIVYCCNIVDTKIGFEKKKTSISSFDTSGLKHLINPKMSAFQSSFRFPCLLFVSRRLPKAPSLMVHRTPAQPPPRSTTSSASCAFRILNLQLRIFSLAWRNGPSVV